MKKALLIALTLVTTTAFAGPGMGHGPKMKFDPEQRMDRMAETLELTDAQRTEIESIFEEQHEKMKTLHDETRERVDAVLTAEQRDKAQALQEERKEKMKERMERMQQRLERKNAE
ncbi:LTXXQ motif family [Alloalcanivorax dieselolei B5]|uniref:LTXXQ motif family n=1 Tax=Alcanivorax dieselolei (strain DSM 16502 / CGMCC 1.3690 / MCCC 1A00001 / B-5) TaxID=930169 RepID=K0CDP2_ALCDB|nr:Spy/CpxP family protein refolding chaperone [Alloalcanivorax dieselolei]AFT71724.1 LTXXQ motif family [Alloalcanivorax dieselolei B5]GGK02950.1 hypothetical protein GCM10007426_35020 [Alloalcanivorax dieselolei]